MRTQKPKSVKDTLEKAWKLIRDKRKWVQNSYAQDRFGNGVSETDPSAVKFCSIGAIYRIDGPFQEQARQVLKSVAADLFSRGVISVNDGLGRRAVVRMWKHAIKKAS